MRIYKVILAFAVAILIVSCGGGNKKNKNKSESKPVAEKKQEKQDPMKNKGIGPIKSVDISKPVDKALAKKGEELFKAKCSACHKTTKRFIGPNPTGVLKRRSPEWVMNMIMNPNEMVQKDPIAKDLLMEYSAPMADQSIKKDEARAILEFFRTLK